MIAAVMDDNQTLFVAIMALMVALVLVVRRAAKEDGPEEVDAVYVEAARKFHAAPRLPLRPAVHATPYTPQTAHPGRPQPPHSQAHHYHRAPPAAARAPTVAVWAAPHGDDAPGSGSAFSAAPLPSVQTAASDPSTTGLVSRLKAKVASPAGQLVTYLFLWYAFNAGFNVTNKQLLNKFPHPWIVSWFQLATGLLFLLPAWRSGFRARPVVDKSLLMAFLPVALLHAGGHASQVASMGLGTVFFTHVIKASEPVIGTLVVLAFTGKIAPWYVNACLAPVVGGVAYASMKPGAGFDLSALWSLPSLLALGSTVAFAIAKLLAKELMTPEMKKERKLDAANNYAVLTCCSSAVLLLPSLLAEGPASAATFAAMDPAAQLPFLRELLTCGAFYYAYNEMGFRVLDLLGPVSQAVANSAKRVVILFAAVLFLGETVTTRKLIGSTVAIGGVTLYSLAKAVASKVAKKPKKIQIALETDSVEQAGTWQP